MKKIMLVLLRTLGDVVLLNTLVETVKNYHGRDSHLTVFVNPEWADIVRNNPTIDTLRDDMDWFRNFYEIQKEALTGGYDEVMIPQQTTGEDNAWHQYPESRNQNLYDFYVTRCGIPKGDHVDRKIRMYPGMSQMEGIAGLVPEGQKIIAVHTTSGNPYKDLTREQWMQIVDKFYPMGYVFAQVGHEKDAPLFPNEDSFGPRPKDIWIDLRGKMTINEINLFIGTHCEAFMGLDSGLSFVAAATGKPCFVWYGCTIPLTSGPWGENVHTLVSKECQVAKDRNHVRCHAQCGAKPNCVQLFEGKQAAEFAWDRLKPAEATA